MNRVFVIQTNYTERIGELDTSEIDPFRLVAITGNENIIYDRTIYKILIDSTIDITNSVIFVNDRENNKISELAHCLNYLAELKFCKWVEPYITELDSYFYEGTRIIKVVINTRG